MIRWSLIWARKFHDVWTVLFLLENLFSSRTTRLKFFEISTHFLLGAFCIGKGRNFEVVSIKINISNLFSNMVITKKRKKALWIFCFLQKFRFLFLLLLPYNDNFWQALYAHQSSFLWGAFFIWIFCCLLKNCSEYVIINRSIILYYY